MIIVGRDQLTAFGDDHADARKWIENWIADTELASWATPHEVRDRYPSVSFLGGGLAIFNVKGNQYRMETRIAYQTKVIVVEWIGTHAEYDKRNANR
jgi:mRNA interferase HigB